MSTLMSNYKLYRATFSVFRIPASWCQNNTIKPSCGRIPQRGYISGFKTFLKYYFKIFRIN